MIVNILRININRGKNLILYNSQIRGITRGALYLVKLLYSLFLFLIDLNNKWENPML